jgi:hypothetical protein
LALILHNMHSSTWAHFKTHQISFLVYPEDWGTMPLKNVGTYLPIYTASYPRRWKYHSWRSLKTLYEVLKKNLMLWN